jgi:hypothetical protein
MLRDILQLLRGNILTQKEKVLMLLVIILMLKVITQWLKENTHLLWVKILKLKRIMRVKL